MKQALIGAGGHAREICAHMGISLPMFVEDVFYEKNISNIFPLSTFNPIDYEVIIAIGDCMTKLRLVEKILPPNTKYFTYIHSSAIVMNKDIVIGDGVFIGAGCILTTNIVIGDHVLLNRGVHVGHDSVIGKYSSLMPSVIISGNVLIGNSVYVGSNSCVKEKINICDNVVLGLNSGVIKNIAASGTYVGIPTNKI